MRRIATVWIVGLLLVTLGPTVGQMSAKDEKGLNDIPGTPTEGAIYEVVYSGTTVDGPEWNRPYTLIPECIISNVGPVQYFDQPFFVDADGLCDIDSQQNYDGYLHFYAGNWSPTDQCTNLIELNDDGNGGIGTSNMYGLAVTGGMTYWVITSSFAPFQEGDFTNTISCDVPVTLGVPTPTFSGPWMTALILVLLAGGLIITRFRLG